MKKRQESEFNYWFLVAAVAVVALIIVIFFNPAQTRANNQVGGAISKFKVATPTPTPAGTIGYCSDGTLVNYCSTSKPKYCNANKLLVNDCTKCGCPGSLICQASGSCLATFPTEFTTYIGDNLDRRPDSYRGMDSAFNVGNTSFNESTGPKVVTSDNSPLLQLPNNGYITSVSGYLTNEKQKIYLFAATQFDETDKIVKADYSKTGYEVAFSAPLSLCLDRLYYWYNCPAGKKITESNVKIWLLGSSWYIRGYDYETLTLKREDGKTLVLSNSGMEIADNKNWNGRFSIDITPFLKDGIGSIQITNDLDQTYKPIMSQSLLAGESINIIKNVPGYKFEYLGLTQPDYDQLTFNIKRDYVMNVENGYAIGDFLSVSSGKQDAFQIETFNGYITTGNVYFGLVGFVNYTNSTGGYNKSTQAVIFYVDPTTSQWEFQSQDHVAYYYKTNELSAIKLRYEPGQVAILLPEITEENSFPYAYSINSWHLNMLYDTNLKQFVNELNSQAIDKVGYSFGETFNYIQNKEAGFVSFRGTSLLGIRPNFATFIYPLDIVKARYTLNYGGDDIAWSGGAAVGSN